MKKFALFFLLAVVCLLCILSGCGIRREKKQYTQTFLTLFDTVTTVVGCDVSQEAFSEKAQAVYDELEKYHILFDIYNDYEGVNNLKTVNDSAGIAPVAVDRRIIDLLLDAKRYYALTDQKVNAAMGSVLSLWHEARTISLNDPENACLPDADALIEAARHMDFDSVQIDETASTVYLCDPCMSLDVGAVAKGWSLQRVLKQLPEGLLISVGGNVAVTGPKDENGAEWIIGIQHPDSNAFLHTLHLSKGCIVTSGDYQRGYTFEDRYYHHIIDPDTLYPAALWRTVTVTAEDSGLADALSTALFLLPEKEGQALLTACGAEAVWMDHDGNLHYSPGFQNLIHS